MSEEQFTNEELWILKAAIEQLHDEHMRYQQRFPKEVQLKSFDLMQKVSKLCNL